MKNPGPGAAFAATIEIEAQRRFVRWDAELWRAFCAGPAVALAKHLDARPRAGSEGNTNLFRSYMRLGAHGIGLGYYVRDRETGITNAFTLLWGKIIPELLPALAEAERPTVLANLWNLGENLEHAEPWLRAIVLYHLWRITSLHDLPAQVDAMVRGILAPPRAKLAGNFTIHWINFTAHDKRFLPGRIAFLAPRVLVVCDRLRADGEAACALGIWLRDTPEVIGRMAFPENAQLSVADGRLLARAAATDPRVDALHSHNTNGYFAAFSLQTSQRLVLLAPA